MSEFPYLPLFTDALVADTDHLDHAEFGLYLRVLVVMWRSPLQRLPNDDGWLTKRFRCTPETIRSIITGFCQNDGNWITQKRLTIEWQYVAKLSRARSASAKAAWGKRKKDTTAMHNMHMPSNAPTPTPNTKKEEEEKDTSLQQEAPSPQGVTQIATTAIAAFSKPRGNGPDYSDPAVRKARWEQKVMDEINRRLPRANASAVINSYLAGEPKATKLFNDISADMKARDAQPTQH